MNAKRRAGERLAPILLGISTTLLAALILTLFAWWRSAPGSVDLEALDEQSRRELVDDLLTQSPGVYQWAWYAPEMGYTLRPDSDLRAWGDSFHSNPQGFRTGPLGKPDNVFRVVFLGDSWTFGMGVSRQESYPEVFARLANARGVASRHGRQRVEAWTLALPGWNLFNSTAAFWHHLDALAPDAVVVGISANDNHSTHSILPNGSATKAAPVADLYGDPHPVIYRARRIDSFRYAERWRISFGRLRDLEAQLKRLKIPLSYLFVGRPRTLDMHARVAEGGLDAPYAVVPLALTKGRWSNKSWGHGTPEANEIYGAYVYSTLAEQLDWPRLEQSPRRYRRWQGVTPWSELREDPDIADELRGLDEPDSLASAYRQRSRVDSAELFDTGFEPGRSARRLQTLGTLPPATGVLGRAATVLVRRPPGSKRVHVRLEPFDGAAAMYPVEVTLAIPSPSDPLGLKRSSVVVERSAPTTLEHDIPSDLEHTVLDVVLEASRAGAQGSVRVASIQLR